MCANCLAGASSVFRIQYAWRRIFRLATLPQVDMPLVSRSRTFPHLLGVQQHQLSKQKGNGEHTSPG